MLFPVLNDWFDNDFSDGFMSSALRRANATAPAVNVKEDNEKYTMEVAVPGIKKEYVRVSLDADGNLELAIENKLEHKEEEPKKTSRPTRCLMMWTRAALPPGWPMASLPSRCLR